MCDDHTEADNQAFLATRPLSRRTLGRLAGAGAIAAILPRSARAADVVERDVPIETPDGVADCYFVAPADTRSPGVLIWPDVFGLRPAYRGMARRLAEAGYAALVVNPYYRSTRAPILAEGASFSDRAVRALVGDLRGGLTDETTATDAKALLRYLAKRPEVDAKRPMGTTGYCMGGAMALVAAATRPKDVAAAGLFHAGGLVKPDDPSSPHLRIGDVKAQLLIAIASNDDERQPDAKDVLRATCDAEKVTAEIEVYPEAMHGWTVPDSAVYDEEKAERAWSRMLALFEATLV